MFELDANGDPTATPTVPTGWRANRAESINEFSEVTGTLWDGEIRAVYKLDLINQSMIIIAENTGVGAQINRGKGEPMNYIVHIFNSLYLAQN